MTQGGTPSFCSFCLTKLPVPCTSAEKAVTCQGMWQNKLGEDRFWPPLESYHGADERERERDARFAKLQARVR